MKINNFNSATYGNLNLTEVLFHMANFISTENEKGYRVILGTDSKHCGYIDHTDYITALIIHRVGGGAIYFWVRTVEKKSYSLKERIYREALISLEFATELIGEFNKVNMLSWPLEIHVDVGNVGQTREIITEVVGMIRGSGFEVKTKPDSYGASKVADRHT